MLYSGPIICPDCKCPISDNASVCPYCYSTAPSDAPWHAGRSRAWVSVIALLALIACGSDHFLGTNVVEAVQGFLAQQQ
jgi:hypothetical protein